MDDTAYVDHLHSRINRSMLMSNTKGSSSPSRKARLAHFWSIFVLACDF